MFYAALYYIQKSKFQNIFKFPKKYFFLFLLLKRQTNFGNVFKCSETIEL